MGDTSKKKNPDQSQEQKKIEETSKGSILKHIPGVSESSLPLSDEEIEEEYWKNVEEESEGSKLEWRSTDMEEDDEYLAEESQWNEEDEDVEEEGEYWEEDEEEDEEDKLRREYQKQESEMKKRFKEGP